MDPEKAREILAEMGIEYSEEHFVLAIKRSKTEVVKLFLTAGMSPNTKDSNGNAVLLRAIEGKNLEIIRVLLDAGADVNAKYIFGNPALIEAILDKNVKVIELLLSAGANVNGRDSSGESALFRVARSILVNVESAELLLSARADVNAHDNVGNTPLILAAGQSEMTQLLLEEGADINMFNERGNTALHRAAYDGRGDIIQLLINNGADLEALNNKNQTPKQVAENSHKEDVLYLLRPESEQLVWEELKSIANDPVILQEFLERSSDPALTDLRKEARRLMEVLKISSVRRSGIGDRLVVAGILPAEGGPVASATMSLYEGYILFGGEYPGDSVPISGSIPNPLAEWESRSVIRFKGEITLNGIKFEGDPGLSSRFPASQGDGAGLPGRQW